MAQDFPVRLAVFIACLTPSFAMAKAFLSMRLGAGPSQISGSKTASQTSSQHATMRLGALQKGSPILGGLDLTSYRIDTPVELALDHPSFGNDVRAFLGAYSGSTQFWLAVGGGQIRIRDRIGEEADKPRQFVTQSYEAGLSYDIYRGEYAKIELCGLLRQTVPDRTWQQSYSLRKIETWQFDVGFELLDL